MEHENNNTVIHEPEAAEEGYDVRVLGKLLLMQSTLHVMPGHAQRAAFVIRGFSGFPGVDGAAVFLCGNEYYGENRVLFETGLSVCRHYHELATAAEETQPLKTVRNPDCKFTEDSDYIRVEVRTSQHYFGCIILHTVDRPHLSAYLPFVENTAALLAILTENQIQKETLEQFNSDLTDAVKKRTAELEDEIAERKAVEARLQNREQELYERNQFVESLVNLLPDIVYVYDIVEAQNVYSNNGVTRILGYTPDEVRTMGTSVISTLMHPDDFKHYIKETLPRYAAARDGDIIDHSYRMQHRNGDWRWLSCREVIYNRLPDGSPRLILGVISDVTAERKAQAQVRETEATMRQVEKMQAIGQLAGGIAHDFNNQLAGIIGYADLLCEKYADNPDITQDAERIITVSRRAADLTSQLLTFSRKGTYLSVDLSMNHIVDEVASILRRTIDPSISVEVEHCDGSAMVKGDPTQLQNAVMNLALNARDAMPGGGTITLTVRMARRDEVHSIMAKFTLPEGPYLCTEVADSGVGIDERFRDKIFEPFFTTKEPGKGTGLGLASVYGAARSHGGAILVDSTPGKGTRMSIYLPAVVAERAGEATEQPRPAVSKNSGTVLLVDDELFIIDSIQTILSRAGFSVSTAKNGDEAIELFRMNAGRFDVVILDMAMPGKSGAQTFRELRSMNPSVKVLISSGYASTDDIRETVGAGAHFIRKPYRGRELLDAIRETLDGTGRRDETGND